MILFYNEQRKDFVEARKSNAKLKIEEFVNFDSTKISWSDIFLRDASKNLEYNFDSENIGVGLYRPFFKQQMSYDRTVIHRMYQLPRLFPQKDSANKVIIVTGSGAGKPFSSLITDKIPNYHTLDTDQCFPLYYYEENNATQKGMFDTDESDKYIRRDAISDFILERAKKQYGKNVTKEDIFYYVYGFLHSPSYRETFANDLKKMLPRLPLVEEVKDFWAFSKAGRQLADLHLNYETVPPAPGVVVLIDRVPKQTIEKAIAGSELEVVNYQVEKMRFPKKDQKETILYNPQITIDNIPPKAYEYIVNGKSAIEWIMERYQITTHKESGITNNPNDWSAEVGNPRYILDLLLSVINVSLQTVDIVEGLPGVEF